MTQRGEEKLLDVGEIILKAGSDENLKSLKVLRAEKDTLNAADAASQGRIEDAESGILSLSSQIAEKLTAGENIEEFVVKRATLREGLNDMKLLPCRIEAQIREIDGRVKEIEVKIFHQLTEVLKVERRKRVDVLGEFIKTNSIEWRSITQSLSKNFSGAVVPPGWANLRTDILRILDSVFGEDPRFL